MASGASLSPPALNINITQESDNPGVQKAKIIEVCILINRSEVIFDL